MMPTIDTGVTLAFTIEREVTEVIGFVYLLRRNPWLALAVFIALTVLTVVLTPHR
jgi:hypothetical protein